MSSKHARLVAAVADAMAAQGFTQKQVATMAGCTQSMLSQALNQGMTLKDERWKLICEGLGLDYDEIIADVPAERERFTLKEQASSVSPQADCHLPQVGEGKESAAPVEETRGVQMFSVMQKSVLPLASKTWRTCFCWRCMPRAVLPRTSKAA